MNIVEKIKILLLKSGDIKQQELAELLGISKQTLSKRMKRNDFYISELEEIAKALNCDLEINFILKHNGEKI